MPGIRRQSLANKLRDGTIELKVHTTSIDFGPKLSDFFPPVAFPRGGKIPVLKVRVLGDVELAAGNVPKCLLLAGL